MTLSKRAENQVKMWEEKILKGLDGMIKAETLEAFEKLKKANFTGLVQLREEIYHLMVGVNASSIKEASSPESYYYNKYLKKRESKKAFNDGHFIHDVFLEPKKLESYVNDDQLAEWAREQQENKTGSECKNPRATAIYKEQKTELEKDGKILVSGDLIENIGMLQESFSRNKVALEVLSDPGTMVEMSCFSICPVTGLIKKARFDALTGNGLILDIKKTAQGMTKQQIKRTLINLGYDMQNSHYSTTLTEATGAANGFLFLMVSDKPPFETRSVKIDFGSSEKALEKYYKRLFEIAERYDEMDFLTYQNEVLEIGFDNWYFSDSNE